MGRGGGNGEEEGENSTGRGALKEMVSVFGAALCYVEEWECGGGGGNTQGTLREHQVGTLEEGLVMRCGGGGGGGGGRRRRRKVWRRRGGGHAAIFQQAEEKLCYGALSATL
eukprot:Tamp_34860.p1 GENE.Tamp_34860~~Tamp_34860.p1  ORF type:complete len:112 (+),score=21.10 Tamp_34860:109-444(+)